MNYRADQEPRRVIAVVGQFPPPWGGQAVMTQRVAKISDPSLEFISVPVRFSSSMAAMGGANWSKLRKLGRAVFAIFLARLRGADTLYYSISGAERFPLWRDALLLGMTRKLFRHTVYHHHAAGSAEFLLQSNALERRAVKKLIGSPDIGIKISDSSPDDPHFFGAKQVSVVMNGIGDARTIAQLRKASLSGPSNRYLLFVGIIGEPKGAIRALDLLSRIRKTQTDLTMAFMGEFESDAFREHFWTEVDRLDLRDSVVHLGVLTGDEKIRVFRNAIFLIVPTLFMHENTPLVILEAMMLGTAVAAFAWRGIPGMLRDGELGLILNVADPKASAARISEVLQDADLRAGYTDRAYHFWLENATSQHFDTRVTEVLKSLGHS